MCSKDDFDDVELYIVVLYETQSMGYENELNLQRLFETVYRKKSFVFLKIDP